MKITKSKILYAHLIQSGLWILPLASYEVVLNRNDIDIKSILTTIIPIFATVFTLIGYNKILCYYEFNLRLSNIVICNFLAHLANVIIILLVSIMLDDIHLIAYYGGDSAGSYIMLTVPVTIFYLILSSLIFLILKIRKQ